MDIPQQLYNIAQVLCKNTIDDQELTQAIKNYEALLQSLVPIELEHRENQEDIQAKGGVAIAPVWVALCIQDLRRTQKFIKGVHQAINTVLAHKVDDTPVEILYAGTGPFATLVLCLLPQYTPQQIQFTLLEINEISFQAVQKVFKQLGFQSFVRHFSQENAVTYQIQQSPDIIVSETMLRALEREPQVAIMLNLLPQTKPEVIMIPANIRLTLGASRLDSTTLETKRQTLDTLLEVNVQTIREYQKTQEFPRKSVQVNLSKWQNYRELNIDTHIQVFDHCEITFGQSGLTIPKKILDIAQAPMKELIFEFQYQLEPLPELTIKTLVV